MASILFKDQDIVAVDKPEGLATIPERNRDQQCLLYELELQLGQKLFIVHRLDKEVSGVVVFAKNAMAHKFLNEQFSKRTIDKTYVALVHGIMNKDSEIIRTPIRMFGSGRMGVDEKRGKECTTSFQVQQRCAAFTLVQVHPLTGRRHQIRVHLYSIGHPIVGDRHYGNKIEQQQFPRLMLHAMQIMLQLPDGTAKMIEAAVPGSFSQLYHKLHKQRYSQQKYRRQ